MDKKTKTPGRTAATDRHDRSRVEFDVAADAQRRLLDAQASIERDYARLRELEARYRYVLESSTDAILTIEAGSRRIVDANPAACERLSTAATVLIGSSLKLVDASAGDGVLGKRLDALLAGADVHPFALTLPDGSAAHATVSMFRQDGMPVVLLHLDTPTQRRSAPRDAPGDKASGSYLAASPDAIVLTDRGGRIVQANAAFLELVQVATERQAKGASLGRWLGRTSVDLGVLVTNLRQRGSLKLFATHLRAEHGALTDVEISAASIGDGEDGLLGFSIRDVGRRLPAASGARADIPKSVDQLTELVGRVPMKDIVGNTAGLIEQMCIRAALELTRDNRVAAAELLGLSRQSLYVKLRRYGMLAAGEPETD